MIIGAAITFGSAGTPHAFHPIHHDQSPSDASPHQHPIRMHALAEELRRPRLEKGWSQEHVGMSIGLSQSQYCAYEHDAIPPLERLQALAQLYGRHLKDFMDLLPVAHQQMHQPQNGAEKNAIGTQAPPQDSTSTNYARPLSDLREHLERLKGRVDLLSRELNDFLRHIGG